MFQESNSFRSDQSFHSAVANKLKEAVATNDNESLQFLVDFEFVKKKQIRNRRIFNRVSHIAQVGVLSALPFVVSASQALNAYVNESGQSVTNNAEGYLQHKSQAFFEPYTQPLPGHGTLYRDSDKIPSFFK